MSSFISILINGLAYGLILFLIATGMTPTMGLLRVVNMSHGAIFMISGYFGSFVYASIRNANPDFSDVVAWIIAILAAGILGGLLGLGIEVGFLRPLYASPMSQVLLTIGFIHILSNVSLWLFGGAPVSAPVPSFLNSPATAVQIGDIRIPLLRFFIIVFGAIMAFALWFMQEKTNIGARVRAGMDNGTIAGTLGLNKKTLFTFIFVLGSAIAGISAIVGGSVLTIDQNSGWNILLNSIIVVVVGGSGSISGALISGIILGLVNAFGAAYAPGLSSFLFYIVLIIILVIRPQGLMGRKIDSNKADDNYSSMRAIEKPMFLESMLEPMNKGMRTKVGAYKFAPYAFFLIIAIVLPLISGSSTQNILSEVLVYGLFAASLDIVMGYTGNRSFGHAAYFGAGAYIAGLLYTKLGITSFWIVLIATIVICAILAAVIGYFTLRLTGTNFLLVTMAFGQLLSVVAIQWKDFMGGSDGLMAIRRPSFGFSQASADWWQEWWTADSGTVNLKVYFLILIVVVICYFIMHKFMKASFGMSLKGVKGNEGRMRALGFNTWTLRFVAVIIAGIFAGIAGMLYVYRFKTVNPNIFTLSTSAMPMLMVIIGGGATLWGPMIGAALIILVQNYANMFVPDRWPLYLGAIFIICVMLIRNGFAPSLQKFWNWVGYKLFIKKDKTAKEAK